MKHIQKHILLIGICMLLGNIVTAKEKTTFSLIGAVKSTNNAPIPYATVWIDIINKGVITDTKGEFIINSVPKGKYQLYIKSLGYESLKTQILINKNISKQLFVLKQKSFALDNVIITAKQNKTNTTTAYDINSDAIEHIQASSLVSIMSLLPGGQTTSSNLLSRNNKHISLRSNQNETDNPDFGTAIEVDGIRLGNNASFSRVRGVDTRIVAPNNIAKVEVITGIPSVEHGDLTSGLVKVITKQGIMPLNIKLSTSPKQKQISALQGFQLGKNSGILNLSYDFTRSIREIASPHTTYIRNAFTLHHKKIFKQNSDMPLTLSTTVAGNIGGYNSKADPDEFKDEYIKQNAFNLRGGLKINWDVSTKIISNISLVANINYSDRKYEEYTYESATSSVLAFHGTESGYFVGKNYDKDKPLAPLQLLERGFWAQTYFIDSKPINYSVNLKLRKEIRHKNIISNLKIGAKLFGSGNRGQGVYYGNRSHTPTWREQKYSEEPYLNNVALYAENHLKYKLNKQQDIILTAGLRNDYTLVKDSRYDNVSAISPRFNLRHNIINNQKNKYLKKLSWHIGWGESVKLPSFGILYTRPSYIHKLAFVPGTLADGTTFYAYHIEPTIVLKNKNLRWKKNRQFEFGIQGKVKGLSFSLAYFHTLGLDKYTSTRNYKPFTYYLTTADAMNGVKIPYNNRRYSISEDGTVTVHDNRGILSSEVLHKKERPIFKSESYTDNGSPVKRQGIEWVLDFGKIKSLHTSLRIDGNFYWYKYINNKISASWQGDNQLMTNGKPYQYIGYYYGGSRSTNGKLSKQLTANATFITHIPKLRLVATVKLEGTLINTTQLLSEMPNGDRSFTIEKLGQYLPSETNGNIYKDGKYTATYPLYYTSFDDMNTKIPFKEKLIWAYKNDKNLYFDLSQMVKTTNRAYSLKPQSYSSYFSANINISKEIGKRLKLSFYAHNCLNTMAKVRYEQENIEKTLLNSGLIPTFSYGMSLNIKI